MSTDVQRNLSPAFFCSAPGSNPASQRIWNPLQMPSTGPPASAHARPRHPSPERTGRWRRSGGSRRGRSPLAGPRRRPPEAAGARRARRARPRPRVPRPPRPRRPRSSCPETPRPRWSPAAPPHRRGTTSASSITGLVRNRWHSSSTWRRASISSSASMVKRMAFPTVTPLTPVVAQRRQRALDGRPLRISDAGAQPDLDEHREHHGSHGGMQPGLVRGHAVGGPGQAANGRPESRS